MSVNDPPALPPETARRGAWLERALLYGPALAFGLVLLTLWAAVGWYVVDTPRELLAQQRHELAVGARNVALQTEPVLRQAEGALRAVDLWLLSRQGADPLNDPALWQLVEGVRTSSRHVVDVMLVASTGRLRPLQAGAAGEGASIAGTPAFDQWSGVVPEGLSLGQPLRLGGTADDGALRLPLLMRLSRPIDDYALVMAVIHLPRLQQAQSLFAPGPPASIVMLRADGVALARRPEVPGFAGRNLYQQFPAIRRDLADAEGLFSSTGAATDGRPRVGAYVTLNDFGLKLLLADSEDTVLAPYRRQRLWVLAAAAVLSLVLLLTGRRLGQLQRDARLREASLQATSNAMPMGLFRTDETGRIVYVNDSYLQVHGLKREDIAWGWTTLVPPDQRDMLIQRWKHHMATGEPIDMVRKMKRGDDGRIRWLAVRTAPVLLGGRVAGQAGIVEDVTERGEQQKAMQTLAAIFDMTPDFVCQANEQGDVTYLNPSARAHLRLPLEAPLTGAHVSQYFSAEQLAHYEQVVRPTALREGHWRGRVTVQLQDQRLPMDGQVIVHRDVRGRVETISMLLRDMSQQMKVQRERERSEAMLLAVAHTASAAFLVGDTAGRVIFFNAAFEQRHGLRLADWAGRPLAELFGPVRHAARAPLIEAALAGERRAAELVEPLDLQREAGAARCIDAQYAPLRVQSGQIEGVIAIEVDVTEARREQARLRLASQTDPLTQLLNRTGFEEGARQLLAEESRCALLYLDLDRFKPVNDEHGHPTGDALLKAIALRMRHALRPGDLVGRLGGDEFVVLLPALSAPDDAGTVADKLVQALSAPYHIGDLTLDIGVSIGCCVAEGRGWGLEPLVEAADACLYDAKRAGRGTWRSTTLRPPA